MPFRDRDKVNGEISAQETKGESMSRSNSTWEDSELAPIFIQETTADIVMGISSAGKDCFAILYLPLRRMSHACRAARSIKDNSSI